MAVIAQRKRLIIYDKLFIGGVWTEPSDPVLLEIVSPHDESVVGRAAQARPADVDRAVDVARRIRTGTVTINGAPIGYDGPFGGYKASGIGREYGFAGLNTYIEYNTITV